MKIILYSHTFLPTLGGRELVVHYLARSLHDLGCDVRVVGPTGLMRYRKIQFQYPVNRYPTLLRVKSGKSKLAGKINDYQNYCKLKYDISKFGCDIIHAHTTYPTAYVASLLTKKNSKIPLVLTPHGVDIHIIPHLNHGMRLNPILKPKIEMALTAADCVTSISEGMEQSILDAGTDKNKIVRIPNGVDLKRYASPVNFDVRNHFKIDKHAELIVTVGNYHPRKGHEVILKAMPTILKTNPHAHLVIVGRNTEKLAPLIQKCELEKNVTLTGTVPFSIDDSTIVANGEFHQGQDILAAIYQSSQLYISAGTEHGAEGLSLAVLEAMSCGLPIVASNISGNIDIVKHGVNGYLLEPSDHMQLAEKVSYLLLHAEERSVMSSSARETSKAYAWEVIAKKYLDTYTNILNKKRN